MSYTMLSNLGSRSKVFVFMAGFALMVLLTFSCGVAIFPSPPENVEVMIKRADDLMYSVKNNGKNTIHYEIVDGSGKVEAGYLKPLALAR